MSVVLAPVATPPSRRKAFGTAIRRVLTERGVASTEREAARLGPVFGRSSVAARRARIADGALGGARAVPA